MALFTVRKFVAGIAVLAVGAGAAVSMLFQYPLLPARTGDIPQYAVLDLGGVLTGVRRLAADIAWVQLLQYYGTPEKKLDRETEYRLSVDMVKYLAGRPSKDKEVCYDHDCHDEHHYHPQLDGGVYPDLLRYCYRVVRLDPYFTHAYLYGAGALAWNLNRPDEALELLRYGADAMERTRHGSSPDIHQPYWQLHLYASAIIYRQSGDYSRMTELLERAARLPDAPNMVKTILANIYQKQGRNADSLRLWIEIHDSGDPSYKAYSLRKVDELRKILRL